ncbi:hypothetical protein LOD99_12141 [Oopsacas minuta]|uniref:Uncharacterized protein n=1 Tax=Oopsacas minuta TaxID=111878 RepID=A0AAV7JHE8_9METZ|nr:hypothetical protein LOD99_12141 [Oopsacas minuta]
MIFVRNLIEEKTGMKIDQPNASGGTSSTGSVARRAFSCDSKYIECVLSVVETEHKETLSKLHTHLSAILRIINSDRIINTEVFGDLCTDTYLLIVDSLPWVLKKGILPLPSGGDGLAERSIGTVKQVMRCLLADRKLRKADWPLLLNEVSFTYNSLRNSSTGLSPNEIFYGEKLRNSLDLNIGYSV